MVHGLTRVRHDLATKPTPRVYMKYEVVGTERSPVKQEVTVQGRPLVLKNTGRLVESEADKAALQPCS